MATDFEALYRQYRAPLVAAACKRLGNRADAEELVQEVFLTAWRERDRFDGRAPTAWLNTILRHKILNFARKRRPELVADPKETEASDPGPADTVVAREGIARCLRFLSREQAEAVVLCYVDGVPRQTAARRAGITLYALHKRLWTARLTLSTCLTA